MNPVYQLGLALMPNGSIGFSAMPQSIEEKFMVIGLLDAAKQAIGAHQVAPSQGIVLASAVPAVPTPGRNGR